MNDRDTKTLAIGAAYLAQIVTAEQAESLRLSHPQAWLQLAWISGVLREAISAPK